MKESGVRLHVIDCAHAENLHTTALDVTIDQTRVRSNSTLWIKENLLNIALKALPASAQYVAILDCDIHFFLDNWTTVVIEALKLNPVIQTWSACLDLGPDGLPMKTNCMGEKFHASFAYNYLKYKAVPQEIQKLSHPGYGWAFTRECLESINGLFEYCILGGADRNMANTFINQPHHSFNTKEFPKKFLKHSKDWVKQAQKTINGKLGMADLTISHEFHGFKEKRRYIERKEILRKHSFNPKKDLIKNSYGVFEFVGNKPKLENEISEYFSSREEDENLKV
jgi:hypothetical protein